jgi:hypothetical protein
MAPAIARFQRFDADAAVRTAIVCALALVVRLAT